MANSTINLNGTIYSNDNNSIFYIASENITSNQELYNNFSLNNNDWELSAEDADEGIYSSITVAPNGIEIVGDSVHITNLAEPEDGGDAVNKQYLDETIANLPTVSLATTQTNGLMAATDKLMLDNLNPNIAKTISNINNTELHVINAKQQNVLSLKMIASPTISAQIRTSNLLDVSDTYGSYYIGSNGAINASTPDLLGPYIPVTPGQVIYYTGHVGDTTASSVNRRLHVYTSNQTWIKQLNAATNLRVGQDWSTYGTIPANGAYVRVSWGVTDINVMISVGVPNKYEPYYITPFAPTTSIDFKIGTTDDPSEATTYTFNVPAAAGDQYGFTFDPVVGKLWQTMGHIASYDGETLPGEWQSDRDIYIEGATPSTGAEVIYKLDDNDIVEYNYTPMAIQLNYHVNYFFIEDGLLQELIYYAETFAVDHLTIHTGATFGETNILESDVIGWNEAAAAINDKADITSPAFAGSPTAPTPGAGVNNTRIATTQFVQNKMANLAPVEASGKASVDYSVGAYLMLNGQLCKVTAAIPRNTTITLGSNVEATDVATELNLLFSLIQ